MFRINKINCAEGSELLLSPLTDDLSDLAPMFGADAEEIINSVQRHFHSSKRQKERLTVEALVRASAGSYTSLGHHQNGKPYIIGKDINVSISHSRTHAAVLLSHNLHCGVDIEVTSSRILRLASRIAQPQEKPHSQGAFNEYENILWLTTLWTVKEAVYKSMESQTNIDMLTDICVSDIIWSEDEAAQRCSPQVFIPKAKTHIVAHSLIAEGNILSYVDY